MGEQLVVKMVGQTTRLEWDDHIIASTQEGPDTLCPALFTRAAKFSCARPWGGPRRPARASALPEARPCVRGDSLPPDKNEIGGPPTADAVGEGTSPGRIAKQLGK